MGIVNVLNEIAEHDTVIRGVLANGEWRVIYNKRSFVCLVDDKNAKSLILWKQRIRGKRDRYVTTRYQLYNKKLTKHKAKELYDKIMGNNIKFSKNVNLKKYNRKPSEEKRPISEIEVLKHNLKVLKELRKYGTNLTKGEKISLTRKIKKLERQLYVNLVKV